MASIAARGNPVRMLLFALTTFVSAFLVFQVQPLISRFILPWFGGSPAVWSTCMLFFQIVLFAGYVYAHLLSTHLNPKAQALVHLTLLAAALLCLPIAPSDAWKPDTPDHPAWRIIGLLSACVGLPYFILSSTGPLLQKWFSLQAPGVSPYRLYALSNVGSLLALVSYPFAIEPTLASPAQAWVWSVAFGVFGVLCGCCACGLLRTHSSASAEAIASESPTTESTQDVLPNWGDRVMWFGLAMVASVMLLATTNQVCLDVATVPFLWILPLTIYLLSFILCFDGDRWYARKWYVALLIGSLLVSTRILLDGSRMSIVLQVSAYLAALFFCCMVCHGELARQRPGAKHLTSFYLLMSAGGAGGGLFVGVLAPSTFPAYWEMHVGILACVLATAAVYFRDQASSLYHGRSRPAWIAIVMTMGVLTWFLQSHARRTVGSAIEVSRNFYGVLRIEDERDTDPQKSFRTMLHGSILHGLQFRSDEKKSIPTAYYGFQSGVGLTLKQHHADRPRRVGVIGLGVGTLAAHASKSDTFRFYEINPEVQRLAERHFSYMSDSAAKIEVILGDARLTLEHEAPQNYDVLVLDAFSGDAIPTHLLTQEAAELYLKHLNEDGILAVHISNLHFDLRPVVQGLAVPRGLQVACILGREHEEHCVLNSQWMLVSRRPIPPSILVAAEKVGRLKQAPIQWTDEFSNLLAVLR